MKWCPFCKLILTSVEGAQGISTCCGCGGAWFAAPATASGASVALAAVSPRQSSAPHAASYAGLMQACPVCPGATLVADPGVDPHCAKCGGTWLDYTRLLALAPEPVTESVPAEDRPPADPGAASGPAPPAPEAQLPDARPQPAATGTPPMLSTPGSIAPRPVFRYPDPPVDPSLRSDPDRALAWLMEGNTRYAADAALGPRRTPQTRSHTATGQKPVAVVVTCSDSRVPAELIFDVGIGDIFVIRSAGHVLDRVGLESISYALEHLEVRLVLVLGHSACGAVRAALSPGGPPAGLDNLMRVLRRATEWATSEGAPDEQRTIRLHTLVTAAIICKHVPSLAQSASQSPCVVATAVYNLDTGLVEIVPHEEPPAPAPSAPAPNPSARQAPRSRQGHSNKPPGQNESGDRSASNAGQDLQFAVSSGSERWCTHCMTAAGGDQEFCTSCGRGLVEPWFRIVCPKCRKENLIGTPRCWQCNADLHAAPTTPAPPELHVGRTAKRTEPSCTGVIAAFAAMAAAIRVILSSQ